MNINKKLYLNKTPNTIPSNSLIAAKNIVVDSSGSYITREDGFDVAFECPNKDEFIVGAIPCNNEIVVFTFQPVENEEGTSRIYRYKDNGDISNINTDWKYNGGTIIGTFTYNYKNELIIAVSEYNAYCLKNDIKTKAKIPLKCWNIDAENQYSNYNIEPDIPLYNVDYKLTSNGSLLCGSYTFFIQFAVDDNNYTKWFQITDDILIYTQSSKDKPIHSFMINDKIYKLNFGEIYKDIGGPDTDKDTNISYFENFYINSNSYSNCSIELTIVNVNVPFRIGYIVKHDNDVRGRVFNKFEANTTKVNIINNNYAEEISIDELLRSPNQYYNVKNIINYNNRIYIGNYEEYNNDEISTSGVSISYDNNSYQDIKTSVTKEVWSAQFATSGCDSGLINIDVETRNDEVYLKNPVAFINNNLISKLRIEVMRPDGTTSLLKVTDKDKIYFNYDKNDNKAASYAISTFSIQVGSYNKKKSQFIWSNGQNYPYDIKIVDNVLHLITVDKTDYPFNGEVKDCALAIGVKSTYYYNNNQPTGQVYYSYLGLSQFSLSYPAFYGGEPISSTVTHNENKTYYSNIINTNCNRTFIPYQHYNIFIHYIRKDGSATNGFRVGYIYVDKNQSSLINIACKIKSIPNEYIGYFLSYEDVEIESIPLTCYKKFGTDNITHTCFTNTDCLYNELNISGNQIINTDNKSNTINYDLIDKATIEKHIESVDAADQSIGKKYMVSSNSILYNKSVKTLYRLTPNIYDTNLYNENNYRYHPCFINRERIIYYNKDIIINPTVNNVTSEDGNVTYYVLGVNTSFNFGLVPYNCVSIVQDFAKGATTFSTSEGKSLGVKYNSIISPDKLKNFLEIKEAYKSKPNKSYTNYNSKYEDTFAKTIRRSEVISDESLDNNFRIFETNNYKIIKENKGDITNIVGIGLYLLVHTEYSLFMFDRTPQLTSKSQLNIPDTFDIDYKEVLPSNEGFGGLRDNKEAIISKNGYIWYDSVNKYIFIFVDGKIDIISKDIIDFLKVLDIETVRFAEDYKYNRLLICIYLKDSTTLTLSYSFYTNSYISLHDYTFTDNYKTFNNSYLFDKNKDRKRIYKLSVGGCDYFNLANIDNKYFDTYE